MHDQAARASRKIGGEVRRDDRRGAAREYRVGRREPVEFGESGSLDRDFLRQVFLHPRSSGQRIAQPDAGRDTVKRRACICG